MSFLKIAACFLAWMLVIGGGLVIFRHDDVTLGVLQILPGAAFLAFYISAHLPQRSPE